MSDEPKDLEMNPMRWAMANLRRTGDSARGSQATPVAGRAASAGGAQ